MVPPTDENGAFELWFLGDFVSCEDALDFALPRPDQVEVLVVVDGCEQSFMIDLNEDTVVDISFPLVDSSWDRLIELKEPILVAPCEE